MDLIDWLDEYSEGHYVIAKRLSGNDTLANNTHQAGPYIPKRNFFYLFPSLKNHTSDNADAWFSLTIDSHPDVRRARVVWYNNKLRGGTRDEVRITNLGGSRSALLDPDSTGALTIFAFRHEPDGDTDTCNAWICRDEIEEDIVEQKIGPVFPGRFNVWYSDLNLFQFDKTTLSDCRLQEHEFPPDWLKKFPTGQEIVKKVIELRPDSTLSVDKRLVSRLECEFELFQSLEEAVELSLVKKGFDTIANFITAAQRVLQRRKARAGKSLEYHVREILIEEGFEEGCDFTYQPKAGNNPDFLFPSESSYLDTTYPRDKIRMLAAKTTLKDRWRQVTEECKDLPTRHLLTLQEGISEEQFKLITDAGITLVVPEKNQTKFANSIRPFLITFESFLADIRIICSGS